MRHTVSVQAQVLADYRRLRRAGMPPLRAMTEVRHVWADQVAADVAACTMVNSHAVACYKAADDYAHSMLLRPAYWCRTA